MCKIKPRMDGCPHPASTREQNRFHEQLMDFLLTLGDQSSVSLLLDKALGVSGLWRSGHPSHWTRLPTGGKVWEPDTHGVHMW
jgi:hypothetical protein